MDGKSPVYVSSLFVVLSLAVSIAHFFLHEAPLLPTILGQGLLFLISLGFASTYVYGLSRADEEGERAVVSTRTAGAYLVGGAAAAIYTTHMYLSPEVEVGIDAIAFQATFVASAFGTVGVAVGLQALRYERAVAAARERGNRLAEEQASIEGILEALPDVLCAFGEHENFLWNDRLSEVTGYSDAEIREMRLTDLFADEDRPEIAEAVRRVRKDEADGDTFAVEAGLETKDGERIPYEFTGAEITRSDGDSLGIVGVGRDLSAVKRERRRFEAVFHNTYQFTGLMELDGTLVEANKTALQFGGLRREEVVGKPIWETHWFQIDEETRGDVRQAVRRAAEGEFVRYQVEVQGAEDTRIIDFSIRPVTDESGAVTWLIPEGRDITRLKAYEQELVEAKEEAEKAARLKTNMLANMSHEIRTPLTPIIGFAESLAGQLEDPEARLAGRIEKSGKRLQQTLDSILALSQLESGTYELSRKELDLREVVREASRRLQRTTEKTDVGLETDLPDRPVRGHLSEGGVRRIVENLLENAVKFTPDGGQVHVQVRSEDDTAVLAVEDTGVGIGEEAQSEVFEAFQQESEGMDREYEGTGLGLSIVERLAEAHGGRVEVKSEKGEGSRFLVHLPTDPSPESEGVASN